MCRQGRKETTADRLQRLEETFRMLEEQIDVLSQQGTGPSQWWDEDPAFNATGPPSQRKSSVASTELPADDDAVMLAAPRYPVDDITESENCELHGKLGNLSIKVAIGFALPSGPRTTSPVPDGYAVVRVDEVMKGFEPLELDFPAGEGDLIELGEAMKGTVLWPKEDIVIPNWTPRPPTSQSSNPAQSLPPQPSPARQKTPPPLPCQQTLPPPSRQQTPPPQPRLLKRKSTAAPAASTTSAKESSTAKKAPAKLRYELTDEELAREVDADEKRELAPKRAPPKQYIAPRTLKHFVDMLERPRAEHLPSDYDRSIIQSHNANVQQSRSSSASGKTIPMEGIQSSGSRGGGGRDVSSWHHLMRKPHPESTSWKRSRRNMSSDGHTFTGKIIDHGSANANVSSAEYDEKSHEDTSKMTQKLDQLAAKILRLRMKADQLLSRKRGALLEDEDTSVDKPLHEKGRSSVRHTIKPIVAESRKGEEDEYDFDDAPRRKSEGAQEEKRSTHGHILTQKDRCSYCFENPSRPKHLVVSIGNFTYLMLPQFEPVVPGHCVILPLQHESATRAIDSNAWAEICNFKKCLLKMFTQQHKDVIFMETAISSAKQRRHCMIECIPVPHELSDKAPMYFKKAIDKAEEEWSQHEPKKLIPTSGNLQQVIPENFAYFHVEFGLDRGFVHVIDDESRFSAGFGLKVIRGVLSLPAEDMHRRRRHASADDQKRAAVSFMKGWEPFDWTKQ